MGTETKLEENFGKAGGRDLTRAVIAMAKNYVDIGHLKPFQAFLRALDDAETENERLSVLSDRETTHCLRDSPESLGPSRIPQNILVIMTRSVRL